MVRSILEHTTPHHFPDVTKDAQKLLEEHGDHMLFPDTQIEQALKLSSDRLSPLCLSFRSLIASKKRLDTEKPDMKFCFGCLEDLADAVADSITVFVENREKYGGGTRLDFSLIDEINSQPTYDGFFYGAAMAVWKYGKSVYHIDQDILESLMKATVPSLPLELVSKWPEYSIYVDLKGLLLINGVIFTLVYSTEGDSPVLLAQCFMSTPQNDTLSFKSDLKNCAADFKKITDKIERMMIAFLLNVFCFICADNSEMKNHQNHAVKKNHLRTLKMNYKKEFIAASKVRHFYLGQEMGTRIREARASSHKGSVAPHIRRAHWHGYWTGKGRTKYKLNYLHPAIVASTAHESE